MKSTTLMAVVCLTLAAVAAQAHAHLKVSNPEEGAVVTHAPAAVSLTFSESARITAVSLQKDQDERQPLSAPTDIGKQVEIKVPPLSAGSYILRWRVAASDDNHITSGELHFRVAPAVQ